MLGRTRITVTALAIAAALPGTALAQQDLRSPDTRDAAAAAAAASAPQDLRSPDARDAARAPDLVQATAGRQDLRSPDARDAARGVDVRDVSPVALAAAEPRATSSGFDWGDAGIGAAGMLGLLAVLVGGGLVANHHRRHDDLPMAGAH